METVWQIIMVVVKYTAGKELTPEEKEAARQRIIEPIWERSFRNFAQFKLFNKALWVYPDFQKKSNLSMFYAF